ncbi:2-succinyl-5-enolpyruvyl-6-hydroxy-3-cyclohexene-1-carboxylic-acid synthase [Seonamhaeicola maritimus]|uniref:2-succinyl-5-enolpyruvyl-6-hydroxy-3-cyclohexene-1-carboxylate synthase n=1 Tax=Seonamhaeicola maritimus TaxID=2591822 RepID=A0A5C7GEQ8_9FLAO|nr:2-succinyl-5-enolpyruvyl-6-hydroxy-3-cyclohexene-1-carboxylic-acid synthase [Seonamhaeicola maritimus]TXG35391.1 2-succinyl-5-enolpyruvyl-6-hydroxy-3-cyclohexene-1-carboxylic-acid synthase [Seonamhaeicola maritimus]
MIYPKIPLAQTVIQLCKAKGIKHVVISPGSRNAPLTIGFSNNDFFKCYSIVDERCAAFFAMGIAQQLQEPTAVVCTSGSALLNYYPAVAEAYYSDIPLVVISADRPKHLIGVGDGQTINQPNVFENHILYSANLKLDLKEDENQVGEELPIFKNLENKLETLLGLKQSIQEFNELEINKAINIAFQKSGPIHINAPFDEPLYDRVEKLTVDPEVIPIKQKPLVIDESLLNNCIEDWNAAKRKMILVGVKQPNQIEQQWLNILANDDSVVVFTETTSNIHHENFFPSIDKIIAPLDEAGYKNLQPDIILTFGGLIVSKKIKAFLRNQKPKHHWHIDTIKANDTFFSLNRFIETQPNYFFSKLLAQTKSISSDYRPRWETIKIERRYKHTEYLNNIDFTDLKAFQSILKAIPNYTILQLGNSSTVRYVQLFNINKTLEVYCNRGTSGIDGSTSTAIGCAVATEKQTTLISGDLSFLYDSNGLWNDHIPESFRIIVINNQGGGIFRILPGHKNTDNFNTYFETNHNLTAEHLCRMYGLEYLTTSNELELESNLQSFYSEGAKPKLLEVFTPKNLNDEVLLNYFKFIK